MPAKYLKLNIKNFFQTYNPCSSNPCWAESTCILLNNELSAFKCDCPINRYGKYCHLNKKMHYLK